MKHIKKNCRKSMKNNMYNKKIKYTDEPIGTIKIIPDFLPSPSDLVLREETVKITLSVTKESLDFFKKEAQGHHTQYQKMIRTLLTEYVNYYKNINNHHANI